MNDEKLAQIPRVDKRQPFDGARWNALANVLNGDRAADLTLVDADGAALLALSPDAKTAAIGGATFEATGATHTGYERHSGAAIVTPAQITANTNDYNPTGLSTARMLRLSTNASRNLTGIVAQPNTILSICNVGSFDLVLVHDLTSTAANRFVLPGSVNLTLTPNSAVQLIYDGTSSRWRRCA